ncbi:uncharacterized protein BXZ73DRAFT_98639 [Epithele typhae]|uniref:uncharacterized protein n=1 Tax=Epithele typhae TaxID=378194 RepID=UPI0020081064|nr:uncharacterized protein BXZ73DRAFT_98639 [Epithele typhae]KAH9940811.1 hypothetical protein BXZ73DRAFT_98639 [Epithele typhae]
MLLQPLHPSARALAFPPQHAPLLSRATPRSLATVDRFALPPAHADDPPVLPLEPAPNFSYVPRSQPLSPSPDPIYPSALPEHLYDEPQNTNHPAPEYEVASRQPPPSIHTNDLLYSADQGNFTPSPTSSPADAQSSARHFSFPQPMSAPHSQNAFPSRFTNDPSPSASRS